MRIRLILSSAVLLLAFTGVARAQQTPAASAAAPALSGTFDFGFRASSVDGDKARWERYRDMRDGVTTNADFGKDKENYVLRFQAANIGYHDQQYFADYNKYGKLKVSAMWNSIPLNYSYDSKTPWRDTGNNVWTLDPAIRTQVQNKTIPAPYIGIGSTAADYTKSSIYNTIATPFDMQTRRDIMGMSVRYKMTDNVGLHLGFTSTKKSGNQPIGASFAFNNGNELPMSVDTRTNDVTAALEWAKATQGMFRVAWDGSWFNNAFQSLTWDNPLRATDYSNGKTPPNGPWDSSGYSNGNGPAYGRIALAPDNSLSTFTMLGLYKLPSHSVLNGQLAITSMKQDDALIPWTTNANIANAATYVYYPGIAALPRASAQAEVKGINAVLNYSTRPNKYFGFDMRYRYNDHKNNTPLFDATDNVRFDAVPEHVDGTVTEQLDVRRNTFEAGTTLNVIRNASLRIGYIVDDVKRTGRSFANDTDYTFRLALDSYGNQYVMLRGVYESTRRVADGFSEASLEEGGLQPGLRFYDEADMDRNKGTAIVSVTPNQKMELTFSLAAGKDTYKGEGHEFGLLDNNNTAYNVLADFYVRDNVTLGGNFGVDKFSSLQKSRNANPLGNPPAAYESWLDPNRDWNLDNDETVKNFGLYLDMADATAKNSLRFSYNYSDSDNAFIHSGPRIQALSTNAILTPGDSKPCASGLNSCFEALPSVTNKWTELRADVKHMFNAKVGMGVAYWYEQLKITDFATLNNADGSVRIDPLGAIQTGYGNRPYKGQTGMVRLIYIF